MSPTVVTKPEELEDKIVRLIHNEDIPYDVKSIGIKLSKTLQLFDCSKDELVIALEHLKKDGIISDFCVGRRKMTIILDWDEDSPQNNGYDVFVSHATKDKIAYVDDLYKELKKLGIKIFYDKEELSWGDDWKKRILMATRQSEFAIIVISKNFFGREWTEKELQSFLSRQNKSGQKVILPVLYNVTQEEFVSHYPKLDKIQYIKAEKNSKKDIAILFAKEYIKRSKNKE